MKILTAIIFFIAAVCYYHGIQLLNEFSEVTSHELSIVAVLVSIILFYVVFLLNVDKAAQ